MKGLYKKYPVSTLFDEQEEELAGEAEKMFVWQLCHHVYRDLFEVDYLHRKGRLLVVELASLAMLHLIGRRVNYVGRHLPAIQEHAQEMKLSTLASFMSIIKTVELLFNQIIDVAIE